MSVLEHSKLLFPACGRLLPKRAVVFIDRMLCELSAFFNLFLEKQVQRWNSLA